MSSQLLRGGQHDAESVVFDLFEYHVREAQVLVAAKHLVGTAAEWVKPNSGVTYFHILLDHHDVLISNGLLTESFQPSLRSFNGISAQMRRSLTDTLPLKHLHALFRRSDAMRSLKAQEVKILVQKMFPSKNQPETAIKGFVLAA